ncbi:Predicted dehydrogenase [Singulisphaera sp. GP187]|uniref:Gfo/Idh/MocA family protein n=1 Tax=Singulisphaera sp. GP187 TaxID=1882752 RepID=UPI00092A1A29|nr:Gfo/Idh/MocA family oxidoreductase [Singulisphaera sp. GP187]SIO39555.1 Predicted dehydrogenase [Singulisphaera sp. GP187]
MESPANPRILVVGLGSIGRRHARLLAEREDVEVLLCDVQRQTTLETAGLMPRPPAGVFLDYAEALEAQPDLVFLCTPTSLHAPMAGRAMASGADLFIEKPIADSWAKARDLVERARYEGRFLQVGYMLRFDTGLRKLKEIIDEGGIGRVVAARAMIGTYVTLLNAHGRDRDEAPNSLLLDYTHEFDFVRWMLGDVADVVAAEATLGRMGIRPTPNVIQLILTMASGVLVQVHMDYVQYPQRRTFDLYGDRGSLSFDFMTGEIQRFRFGALHRWESMAVAPMATRVDDLYRRQIASLLESRRDGKPPMASGEDAAYALQIAEAAIESAEAGRRVSLRASPPAKILPINIEG